jgi:hypothetical protein
MSTKASDTETPFEELSDSALKAKGRSAAKAIERLNALDAGQLVAEKKVDSTLVQLENAIETAEQVDAEFQRRSRAQEEHDREQAPFRIDRWNKTEAKAKKSANVLTVLGHVASFGHPELVGETALVGSRLTDEELDELTELVRRKRALLKGTPNAEELTDTETGRYEALVGKAAGDEGLFERKRRDKVAKAKLGQLKEERRMASLPKRPIYAEPGSIELPRTVFSWLVAEVNRDGAAWGISEVGMLAAILLSFENRIPILKGGSFVEEAGELVLAAPWGMGSEVPLVNRVQGSTLDGNGGVKVRSSLATLHRNNWLVVEQSVSEIRVRLGENARKLRNPEQRKGG